MDINQQKLTTCDVLTDINQQNLTICDVLVIRETDSSPSQ
jgi:hypothetical protein